MRIAVVSSMPVPLVYGGMNRLLEGLSDALRQRHPTDLVTLPVDERTAEGVVKGYYDFYHMDLSAYDVAISYKAPAYMVNHPVQVLYLSHRMRVFYDLYEPRDTAHARMRRLIHWMDNWALSTERIPHLYTIGPHGQPPPDQVGRHRLHPDPSPDHLHRPPPRARASTFSPSAACTNGSAST